MDCCILARLTCTFLPVAALHVAKLILQKACSDQQCTIFDLSFVVENDSKSNAVETCIVVTKFRIKSVMDYDVVYKIIVLRSLCMLTLLKKNYSRESCFFVQ